MSRSILHICDGHPVDSHPGVDGRGKEKKMESGEVPRDPPARVLAWIALINAAQDKSALRLS